jgi:hypothetical protein
MDLESTSGRMVEFSMETGLTTIWMAMGITLMLMESNTTANTLLTRKKGTVSTIGQMGELM